MAVLTCTPDRGRQNRIVGVDDVLRADLVPGDVRQKDALVVDIVRRMLYLDVAAVELDSIVGVLIHPSMSLWPVRESHAPRDHSLLVEVHALPPWVRVEDMGESGEAVALVRLALAARLVLVLLADWRTGVDQVLAVG